MVRLDIVRKSNAGLIESHPLVAVFVGGTSGIGEFTLRALAKTHGRQGKGLRAYIVGRNAAAAEEIIANCTGLCPSGQFRFVKAGDLSLLKDVDRVCAEVTELEEKESAASSKKARIDILVMSQHYFPLLFQSRKGRSLTSPISIPLPPFGAAHLKHSIPSTNVNVTNRYNRGPRHLRLPSLLLPPSHPHQFPPSTPRLPSSHRRTRHLHIRRRLGSSPLHLRSLPPQSQALQHI